ncbi:MAG: hypothetical protein IT445_11160 [Phycisphaeraceae bacterium]|nr:hypothetical protein [Phycisphaeraceae bacterium]
MDDNAKAVRIAWRNDTYKRTLESYIQSWCVDKYADRSASLWHRDYSSIHAYEASVSVMRERWRSILSPPPLVPSSEITARPADLLAKPESAFWLELPLGGLSAEGILALPVSASKTTPAPLIIAQHGMGAAPEHLFALNDDSGIYHGVGNSLLAEGFAVLAPLNLSNKADCNRIHNLATLMGSTLAGIEFVRLQRLLDAVLAMPEIKSEGVGMWGLSLGGMATQLFAPLETRITCAISSAWFNHRPNKLARPDPRYSCYLDSIETYVFLRDWLSCFADEDLQSLIIPRAIMYQSGKNDGIAWWPQLVEVFHRLRFHYEQLGIADRVALDLHEGYHEIRVETGVAWMKKFLMRA